jgi:hypothetical protein
MHIYIRIGIWMHVYIYKHTYQTLSIPSLMRFAIRIHRGSLHIFSNSLAFASNCRTIPSCSQYLSVMFRYTCKFIYRYLYKHTVYSFMYIYHTYLFICHICICMYIHICQASTIKFRSIQYLSDMSRYIFKSMYENIPKCI